MTVKPFQKSLSKNLFLRMVLKKHFLRAILRKLFFKLRSQNYFSKIVFRVYLFTSRYDAHPIYVSAFGRNALTEKIPTLTIPLLSLCSGDSGRYLNGKNINIHFSAIDIPKLEGYLDKRD